MTHHENPTTPAAPAAAALDRRARAKAAQSRMAALQRAELVLLDWITEQGQAAEARVDRPDLDDPTDLLVRDPAYGRALAAWSAAREGLHDVRQLTAAEDSAAEDTTEEQS